MGGSLGGGASRRGDTVLLVEDEPLLRRSVVRALTRSDIAVTTADNAADARELLLGFEPFRAMFMDVNLPASRSCDALWHYGAELLGIARTRHPTMPIAVVSGLDLPAPLFEDNEVVFLPKPVDLAELVAFAEAHAPQPVRRIEEIRMPDDEAFASLTNSQTRALALRARGFDRASAARMAGISLGTLDHYIKQGAQKLGLRIPDAIELFRYVEGDLRTRDKGSGTFPKLGRTDGTV